MLSLRRTFEGLRRFLFAPVDPLPLAVYRIAYGALVTINALTLWPLRATWFGEVGVLSSATARALTGARLDVFRWLPHTDAAVTAVLLVHLVAALALTAGLFSRASAAIVFVTLASLHHRNPLIVNSGDTLLRVMAFYLLLAPAGRALSLDERLRRRWGAPPSREVEPWAQRLMQLQLTLVYLATALWKLQGESWVNGTAVYYTSRLTDFRRLPLPLVFDSPFGTRAMTWTSLALELSLGTLIWFEELRQPLLAAAVLFHLGIEWTMNVPLFEWITMAPLVLFVRPEDLRRVGVVLAARAGRLVRRPAATGAYKT